MAIELRCACGKRLQLPEENAGALGQCPACGRVMPARDTVSPLLPPGEVSEAVTAGPVWTPALTQADGAFPDMQHLAAPLDEGDEKSRPPYKLWSPAIIVLFALLTGPIGPFLMMAINNLRLGRPFAACLTAAGCLLITAGFYAASFALMPDTAATLPLAVPIFLCTWGIAWATQRKRYDAHISAGGEMASGWAAALLSVCGLLVFLGVILGTLFAYDARQRHRFGTLVDVGNGQEIYYARGATAKDATALGGYLRRLGFFNGRHPCSVQVSREGECVIIAFNVLPEVLNDVRAQQQFRALAQQASPQIFSGAPVSVWLCDHAFEPEKKLP